MEKKLKILIAAALFVAVATGCQKKVHMTSETNEPTTEETMASIIQEDEIPTEKESAELSVDALEETNITEDVSSTTQTPDPAKSASAVTGVHKQTETVPIVTEVTEPVETTSPVSQILPGDNWETPDL